MKYIFSFLTVAILIVGCKNDTGSPKGTVAAFIEAMKKGDIEAVKKLVTKNDASIFAMAESVAKSFGKTDEIEKMKKEFIEKSKDVSFAIKDEKIDGDKATVNVDITQDSKTTTQPFQLIKEDGSWKLSFSSTRFNMGGANRDMNDVDINMGDSIKKAMEHFKDMNLDSLKDKMKEAGDKVKEFQKNNPDAVKKMEEAMKKLEEAQKTNH